MFVTRRATLDDCQLIRSMAEIAFPHTYRELLSPEQIDFMMNWMYSLESIQEQMQQKGHIYLIAYKDGEVAGYASTWKQAEHLFHLEKLYLLPQFQKDHGGGFLFREIIRLVKSIHPEPCTIQLNVNRYNVNAVSFYEHMGMHKADQGDFHIGNGYYMTDYIMEMDV